MKLLQQALGLGLGLGLASLSTTMAAATVAGPVQARQLAPRAARSEDFLVQLHKNLLDIESITGNEYAVSNWLANFLREQDWTVELQEIAPKRPNVIAYPPGVQKGKARVLLTTHIDTVPPFVPYRVTKNATTTTIWGRGANDAKGAAAAQIVAALNVLDRSKELNLPADALALLFVVGEEGTGDGMKYFSSHAPHNYTHVIFGEPTEGKLVCGHKGALGMLLNVTGKAAHSGYPHLGVNANNLLIEAMAILLAIEKFLPSSEKFGDTILNIGTMIGGTAINVVSPASNATVAIRLGASTPENVRRIIEKALSPIVKRAAGMGGKLDIKWPLLGYPPVDIACNIDGFKSETVAYGTDIPNLQGTHQKWLYGPGSILSAHTLDEFVTLSDLNAAVTAYEKIILHTLGIKA
ncbi:Zn-dependent exopeptidase [Zopfia rhizophila CBS 207.26]|uniref:Zn-dependent exopeptidase n=1 Tax=Zopfia rhizophila CBS 207.26 TaxID=1314779 RepID=A0A6A6E3A9_9PEZI|nr:Zn-dependent exopeptidase [Zopfia rhizophila CBS 207.26]